MQICVAEAVSEEEALVAELELLGIRYLSRQTTYQPAHGRPPDRLLVALSRQPNARVRQTIIAVFLAHPLYAQVVALAVAELDATDPAAATDLRLLYTAAMFLQRKYRWRLLPFLEERWLWLPDLFSAGLGLPSIEMPVDGKLTLLGHIHGRATGKRVNWSGTYNNVAQKLVRRWELEQVWSRKQ